MSSAVNIPDQWLGQVVDQIIARHNNSIDPQKLQFSQTFKPIFPIIFVSYGFIIICGTISNFTMIAYIFRNKLYKQKMTMCLLMNIAFSDILKSAIVLPINLRKIWFPNWNYGHFLCAYLPLIQNALIHVTMLTFLCIAIDRYIFIVRPNKPNFYIALITVISSWILAIGSTWPYSNHNVYFDLQLVFGKQYTNSELCMPTANLTSTYVVLMIIFFYLFPLAIIFIFLYCASMKMNVREKVQVDLVSKNIEDIEPEPSCSNASPSSTTNTTMSFNNSFDELAKISSIAVDNEQQSSTLDELHKSDVEQRLQKYLAMVTSLFAVYIFPLNMALLIEYVQGTSHDHYNHLNLAYAVAYLSTCTTPAMFASWSVNYSISKRLKILLGIQDSDEQTDPETEPIQNQNQHEFRSNEKIMTITTSSDIKIHPTNNWQH